MDTESDRNGEDESHTRYRRQRGLLREDSNIPDSQPPSAQTARESTPDYDFDSDLEPVRASDLKHFDFRRKYSSILGQKP